MDIEIFTIYLGHTLGIITGLYIAFKAHKGIGVAIVIGFLAFMQGAIVATEWDYHDQVSSCLDTIEDYYACLPWGAKVSAHLSQAATILIPVSIFFLGKLLTRQARGTA